MQPVPPKLNHDAGRGTCYQVRLGHVSVRVTGHTPHEAIQQAKHRMCLEMPRLWDVIHDLDDQRFQVDPVR